LTTEDRIWWIRKFKKDMEIDDDKPIYIGGGKEPLPSLKCRAYPQTVYIRQWSAKYREKYHGSFVVRGDKIPLTEYELNQLNEIKFVWSDPKSEKKKTFEERMEDYNRLPPGTMLTHFVTEHRKFYRWKMEMKKKFQNGTINENSVEYKTLHDDPNFAFFVAKESLDGKMKDVTMDIDDDDTNEKVKYVYCIDDEDKYSGYFSDTDFPPAVGPSKKE